MISVDEGALICDFAETYHVFDYRGLPLTTAALFAVGLRETSRIKMRLSGQKVSPGTALLMAIFDRLSWLVWSKTKDGQKNRNKPAPILDALKEKEPSEIEGFDSGKNFEEMRRNILEGG